MWASPLMEVLHYNALNTVKRWKTQQNTRDCHTCDMNWGHNFITVGIDVLAPYFCEQERPLQSLSYLIWLLLCLTETYNYSMTSAKCRILPKSSAKLVLNFLATKSIWFHLLWKAFLMAIVIILNQHSWSLLDLLYSGSSPTTIYS